MTTIRFVVPGEPQGKGRAKVVRIAGFTRLATPAKTVAYEGLVAQLAQQAMAGAPLLGGPVSMRLELRFSVPRSASKRARFDALAGSIPPTKKPDADNVLKAVCDGLNGVAFRDDAQVVDVRVVKRFAEVPGVVVELDDWLPAGSGSQFVLGEVAPSPCIGRDPACPCQDGLACHYRDAADGTKAMPLPSGEVAA